MASSSTTTIDGQALKGFAMGGIAGVITKTTVAPIDRVKLVLQLQSTPVCATASTSSSAMLFQQQQHPQYKGIVDCFRKLCAEQGVRSLWRGNGATVVRAFPSNAMNLAFRDMYRVVFVDGVDFKSQPTRFAVGNLLAGGAAGATALLFLYPLDFARTRLAVDATKSGARRFNGIADCFVTICAKEGGIHGLYKGFCTSLQFTMVSRAVFFGLFDSARAWMTERQMGKPLSFTTNWALAQASVITSSVACYPLDTIRRKIMLEAGKTTKAYTTFWDCLVKTLSQEGPASLYKGALSNSLRCTSGAMILAVYYEMVKYL